MSTSDSTISDLGEAFAVYIGAGDDPRERFTEVHEGIEKNRTLTALLRTVEAERLIGGLDGPRITADMRDVATASGADGATNRDDLFYAVTDALVTRGVRLVPESAAPVSEPDPGVVSEEDHAAA